VALFICWRHDLRAAATCPGKVLTKTEARQSEDGSFSGLSRQEHFLLSFVRFKTSTLTIQVRGFAPIGTMECWNIGKMGLGYCNIG
jgi:hypothetical protein